MSATAELPAKIKITITILSVGLALMLLAAFAVVSFTERPVFGALFFIAPLVAFFVPMLLTANQLRGPARGRAMLFSTAAVLIAAATLTLSALLSWTSWVSWVVGAVLALVAGLAAAAQASTSE